MQNKTQPSILDHSSPRSPVRGSYSSFKKRRDGCAGCLGRMICQRFAGFISEIICDASSGSICIGSATPLFCCLLDDCRIIFPRCELPFVFCICQMLVSDCLHHLTKGRHLWCRIDCFGSVPPASFSYWQ